MAPQISGAWRMSLRWRKDGQLVCGAKSIEQERDCYIDDTPHYQLSLLGAIEPGKEEEKTGLWNWVQVGIPHWDMTHRRDKEDD